MSLWGYLGTSTPPPPCSAVCTLQAQLSFRAHSGCLQRRQQQENCLWLNLYFNGLFCISVQQLSHEAGTQKSRDQLEVNVSQHTNTFVFFLCFCSVCLALPSLSSPSFFLIHSVSCPSASICFSTFWLFWLNFLFFTFFIYDILPSIILYFLSYKT